MTANIREGECSSDHYWVSGKKRKMNNRLDKMNNRLGKMEDEQ